MKSIRILYVDDDPQDTERYTRLLNEKDKITVFSEPAPNHPDELSLKPLPDFVLIDYRLLKNTQSGTVPMYRGGTLANYIAEKLPNLPLAIFSTRDILKLYPNYEKEIQSADLILYKEDINCQQDYWRKYIAQFVHDFKLIAQIRRQQRNWKTAAELLKANSSELEDLQRASPPRKKDERTWDAHDFSRWVLRVLFRYPGIFYDSLYASTALGLKEESFLSEKVQSFFESAQYIGIFAGIGRFWWRNRLQELAFKLIREAEIIPVLSDSFLPAFEKKTGIKLEPSICIYSKEKNANAVCYILQQPVKMKYTLEYLPDDRPEAMEPARISFKAILEENIKKDLLPPSEAERVRAIRRSFKR